MTASLRRDDVPSPFPDAASHPLMQLELSMQWVSASVLAVDIFLWLGYSSKVSSSAVLLPFILQRECLFPTLLFSTSCSFLSFCVIFFVGFFCSGFHIMGAVFLFVLFCFVFCCCCCCSFFFFFFFFFWIDTSKFIALYKILCWYAEMYNPPLPTPFHWTANAPKVGMMHTRLIRVRSHPLQVIVDKEWMEPSLQTAPEKKDV